MSDSLLYICYSSSKSILTSGVVTVEHVGVRAQAIIILYEAKWSQDILQNIIHNVKVIVHDLCAI